MANRFIPASKMRISANTNLRYLSQLHSLQTQDSSHSHAGKIRLPEVSVTMLTERKNYVTPQSSRRLI